MKEYQNEFDNPLFALTYIDNDDVPELLLFQDYYGAGTAVTVYSYHEGVANHVGDFGTCSELVYGYKSSLIIDEYLNFGEHYRVLKLENGVA